MTASTSPNLEFRGGSLGALIPFALFLVGVVWLALSGAPDEKGFWPVLLAAITAGLALARDRQRFAESAIASMSQPIVGLMIFAWMLAGVLGVVLAESGMVQALVWAAQASGMTGAFYVGAAFLVCAVVSTSTGTSFGTILIAGPLLYPAGASLAAPPVILIGAILGGATFGDSISPVSDTTIASAGSQNTDIPGTVRSRLKYVIPTGIIALLASMGLAAASDAPQATMSAGMTGSPHALPMLLIPVFVIGLLARRRHLLEGLLFGIVAGIALALLLRLLTPGQIIHIDRAAYAAKGIVIDGLSRGVGVSVFTLLLMALVGTLQASGLIENLVARLTRQAQTTRLAEFTIVGAVSAAVLLTTHSVVAVLAVGPLARELGVRADLHAYRRANLLDMTVCTWPFILPYFLPTILASGATAAGVEFGMPRVSPLEAGLANTYSWALAVAVALAVTTGYGRATDREVP